jgi:hypothetical protein
LLAAIASIVSFLSDKLEKLTRHFPQGVGWLGRLGHYSGTIVIYVASAAVPLLLWWMYLATSFWGIQSKKFANGFAAPDWLFKWAQWFFSATPVESAEQGFFSSVLNFVLGLPIVSQLVGIVTWLAKWVNDSPENDSPIAGIYILIAVILFILSLIPTLNANSLHRLYRDRLSTAFIFCVVKPRPGVVARMRDWIRSNLWVNVPKVLGHPQGWKPEEQAPELQLLDQLKLTQLSACYSPYHIINAALNVQGSAYVNQRARNADFFILSRNYIGSEATQYAATTQMESIAHDLNLATAMAVSGAAASPNMGSSTIRPLTPTLTILNVRLGYWLRNPKAAVGYSANRVIAWLAEAANWYFLKEMFSRLDEKTHNVYLTDGGHIENLGIYELLKRRCKLIIASDAEADPEMSFESLVKLQVHARIDLGIRIELPWQPIRDVTLSTGKMIADKDEAMPDVTRAGPHCALGIIHYPKEEVGYLLYIKSSMTGDENDYIVDYKQRHPSFPHETTGDQFFTEQQFEAYRALGFHALHRAVTGEDMIVTHAGGAKRPLWRKWNSKAKSKNPFSEIKRLLQL